MRLSNHKTLRSRLSRQEVNPASVKLRASGHVKSVPLVPSTSGSAPLSRHSPQYAGNPVPLRGGGDARGFEAWTKPRSPTGHKINSDKGVGPLNTPDAGARSQRFARFRVAGWQYAARRSRNCPAVRRAYAGAR